MVVLQNEIPIWEGSVIPTKTAVDILRDPILILDQELRVLSANGPFYRMFQVNQEETEKKLFSELGDGQWNDSVLNTALQEIITNNSFLKGVEIDQVFPKIGHRIFILNARQIYQTKETLGTLPPRILVALEDITQMAKIARAIAGKAQFD